MFVRVFEMPIFNRPGYRFGGGTPMPFVEVDWFRDDMETLKTEQGRLNAVVFIQAKKYYRASHGYVILHPTHPLCINVDEELLLGRRPDAYSPQWRR